MDCHCSARRCCYLSYKHFLIKFFFISSHSLSSSCTPSSYTLIPAPSPATIRWTMETPSTAWHHTIRVEAATMLWWRWWWQTSNNYYMIFWSFLWQFFIFCLSSLFHSSRFSDLLCVSLFCVNCLNDSFYYSRTATSSCFIIHPSNPRSGQPSIHPSTIYAAIHSRPPYRSR